MTIIREPIYNTQIVDINGAKPCITRSYKNEPFYENGVLKNGQWRQCRLQYYSLKPLIAAPLVDEDIDETIYDINNMPIYVAKKEV